MMNRSPYLRKSLFRFCRILVIILLGSSWLANPAQAECRNGACVVGAGPLVTVDSSQSLILNTVFSSLLPGSGLDLDVLEWDGLAQADVDIALLLDILSADLDLASPAEVLDADITLLQLIDASIQAVEADGNLLAVQALQQIRLAIPSPLEGLTIPVGDLLVIDFPPGALAGIDINLLNLLQTGFELFNFTNVLASPDPLSIDTNNPLLSLLGLNDIAGNVELFLQVVEPPSFGCRPEGATIRAPQYRLKLNVDLLNIDISSGVLGGLQTILGPLIGVDGTANISNIELYFELGGSTARIDRVDADAPRVEIGVLPSVASAYIGQIDDSVFFARNSEINPDTDLNYGVIGNIDVQLSALGLPGNVADLDAEILARSHGRGESAAETLIFNGPFPETQSTSGGSFAVATLIGQLLTNLDIQVNATSNSGALGPILNTVGLTADLLLEQLTPLIGDAVGLLFDPILSTILRLTIDQLFGLLGIGIGQAEFTVLGAGSLCPVNGFVYQDDDRDAMRDADETSTGLRLWAKLIPANGTPGGVRVVPVNQATGFYSFPDVFSGDYRIIIDDNPNRADTTPTIPAGWVGTEAPQQERFLSFPANALPPSQNFGLVRVNNENGLATFYPNNNGIVTAGDSIIYSHTFIANVDGELAIDLAASSDPAGTTTATTWGYQLHLDDNCDRQLDANEPLFDTQLVNAGQQVCLLAVITAPADAPNDARHTLILQAEFATDNGDFTQTRQDITVVSSNAGITLQKTADNSSALPGDVVTYTLTYSNNGESAIDNVTIHDAAPPYTELTGVAVCVEPLPDALTSCEALIEDQQIRWQFEGDLLPNTSGQVQFEVRLQQ